ncbi:MAG: hypothetical protein LC768_17595 [Acidobacteria bacterium]|nr:hypothetical protein [Acidobacteriota bacterium]MCA1640108.1 hypothetical protein [Acidobacteriota bacterium]
MRSKHFVALITFFACFAFSSFVVGQLFEKTFDKEILVLLQQDKENGEERNTNELNLSLVDKSFPSLSAKSEIVSEYAEKSGGINDGGFPQDFQVAWRKHMKAWANYSDFLQKSERAGLGTKDIKRLEIQYARDINWTWFEVLRIGRTYGAEFPH